MYIRWFMVVLRIGTLASDPVQVAALAARTMTGRNGLAGAAVFLASGAAAYVTGRAGFVDGGLSVH